LGELALGDKRKTIPRGGLESDALTDGECMSDIIAIDVGHFIADADVNGWRDPSRFGFGGDGSRFQRRPGKGRCDGEEE